MRSSRRRSCTPDRSGGGSSGVPAEIRTFGGVVVGGTSKYFGGWAVARVVGVPTTRAVAEFFHIIFGGSTPVRVTGGGTPVSGSGGVSWVHVDLWYMQI